MRDYIQIFSDGACSGNPGPGGWGSVILFPTDQVLEIGGGDPQTTNNRMEMQAVLEALRTVADHSGTVRFYTDSTYVIRGITQWIWGWRKRGWKTAEGGDVSNKDLWEEIAEVVQKRGAANKIEWHYSRGHIGIPGNERCDEIAVAFSKRAGIDLYEGSLKNYPVNILEVPADTSLPEMRSPTEKKAAHSYLSNIGGLVYRHKDWPSCQRRVTGKSGAKFKKSTSASDEVEILKSWGLPASTPIKEG
ncbi:ribonuclease HI [Bdellovibrio sp. NC01]|uniref:ribonuclease HI n=1 Tax=Bdellovibrio sp. NC01 TaxID=2220073 RepID=UPI00115BEEFB|nr:ribonuclease HI [Bdellovibrio sp. NC01]QDK38922.1 ribonuclease HI [Bdellovibrio sp. NC01]